MDKTTGSLSSRFIDALLKIEVNLVMSKLYVAAGQVFLQAAAIRRVIADLREPGSGTAEVERLSIQVSGYTVCANEYAQLFMKVADEYKANPDEAHLLEVERLVEHAPKPPAFLSSTLGGQ